VFVNSLLKTLNSRNFRPVVSQLQVSGPVVNLGSGFTNYTAIGATGEDYGKSAPYRKRSCSTLLPTPSPKTCYTWAVGDPSKSHLSILVQGDRSDTYTTFRLETTPHRVSYGSLTRPSRFRIEAPLCLATIPTSTTLLLA
jgi:hypothetical protein